MGNEELKVKIVDRCLVPPCLPSPQETLYLSNLDNQPGTRTFVNTFLVYENLGCERNIADPAKTIREALSKVLVYYYPLAGRLRKKEDGKLEVECIGEGVLFVEAKVNNTLSVLADSDSLKQLLFNFPLNTYIEQIHPMVIQVNRFICGGFAVAVTFHHSICDGRGLGQFLKGLAEMARGYAMPSVEPIWCRELLKPRELLEYGSDSIEDKRGSTSSSCLPQTSKESVQMSFTLEPKEMQCMKQGIMHECGEIFTTFEIVTALVWRATAKILENSHIESMNALFAVDGREKFNPPLPNGYYGNGAVVACASATVQELINEPLSHIVNIIKKTKMSITYKYLRSIIDEDHFTNDIFYNKGNVLLSDWRWLGFNEVDFGSGCPVNVYPMIWNENGLNFPNNFIFLLPSKTKDDGFKMITWMDPEDSMLFKKEMESIINEYVKK